MRELQHAERRASGQDVIELRVLEHAILGIKITPEGLPIQQFGHKNVQSRGNFTLRKMLWILTEWFSIGCLKNESVAWPVVEG